MSIDFSTDNGKRRRIYGGHEVEKFINQEPKNMEERDNLLHIKEIPSKADGKAREVDTSEESRPLGNTLPASPIRAEYIIWLLESGVGRTWNRLHHAQSRRPCQYPRKILKRSNVRPSYPTNNDVDDPSASLDSPVSRNSAH